MNTQSPMTALQRIALFLGTVISLPIVALAVIFVGLTMLLPSRTTSLLGGLDHLAIVVLQLFLGALFDLTSISQRFVPSHQ